jgi:flagellar L-ring protein precursor FlgH
MRLSYLLPLALLGCTSLDQVGRAPQFSPLEDSFQHSAMYANPMPDEVMRRSASDDSSLWAGGSDSLFGDRRAAGRGDILTVVIEIDDSAEMRNSSGRDRTGQETMGVGSLFGIPQRLDETLPDGATMAEAVNTNSASTFSGNGSVTRNEKLTLRVAATVVEELPNGVLRIEGQQEVRVNFELRELIVTGYVRPIDISRQNEITYDKIAGARISYGGRGLISNAQQPRYGQQITDIILPF